MAKTDFGKDIINDLSVRKEECKILSCVLWVDWGPGKEDVKLNKQRMERGFQAKQQCLQRL